MPKLEKFEIILDQPVFTAGQKVSGSVNIVLRDRTSAIAVNLEVKGAAHAAFRERVMRMTTRYTGKDVFLHETLTLWQDDEKQEIPTGTHSYPFSIDLPDTCPTNFEAKDGKIHYICRAIIEKKKPSEHKAVARFEVKGQYDLNSQLNLRQPAIAHAKKSCGLLKDGGEIFAKVKLPKSGFATGESIPILAKITNNSTRTIKQIDVALVQYMHFNGKHEGKRETRKTDMDVAILSENVSISPKTQYIFNGTLITPRDALHSLINNHNDVIDIWFQIDMKLHLSGLPPIHTIDVTVPVVIGSKILEQEEGTKEVSTPVSDP